MINSFFSAIIPIMKFTRRTMLKIAGGGALVIAWLPRVALAARGSLQSLRTGLQPGNKTLPTSKRPTHRMLAAFRLHISINFIINIVDNYSL